MLFFSDLIYLAFSSDSRLFTELIPLWVKLRDRISLTEIEDDFWFVLYFDCLIKVILNIYFELFKEHFLINLLLLELIFLIYHLFHSITLKSCLSACFTNWAICVVSDLSFSLELGFIFECQNVEICLIEYYLDRLKFHCILNLKQLISSLASKAVDCLLDSKWAKAKKGEEALFTTRESVVDYCNRYSFFLSEG